MSEEPGEVEGGVSRPHFDNKLQSPFRLSATDKESRIPCSIIFGTPW